MRRPSVAACGLRRLRNKRSRSSSASCPDARPGRIERELSLRAGHNVIYSRTVIEGFQGPTTFAHHAILALPGRERALLLSCSPFQFGQDLSRAARLRCGGRIPVPGSRCLLPRPFQSAEPLPQRGARRLHGLSGSPGFYRFGPALRATAGAPDPRPPPGLPPSILEAGWLWFAFKDPRVMPDRVLWMENRGRHSAPWNRPDRLPGRRGWLHVFRSRPGGGVPAQPHQPTGNPHLRRA